MLETYIKKTILGIPVTFKFFRMRAMPERCLAQAFVDLPERKVFIKIDRGVLSSLVCGSHVRELAPSDPNFFEFRNLVMEMVEEKITRWKTLKTKRYLAMDESDPTETLGLRKREISPELAEKEGVPKYGIESDLDYVDWALKRIKVTGDVEDGAEAVLRTEKGQKMLRENPHSDSLKEEMNVTSEHIIDTGIKADDYGDV